MHVDAPSPRSLRDETCRAPVEDERVAEVGEDAQGSVGVAQHDDQVEVPVKAVLDTDQRLDAPSAVQPRLDPGGVEAGNHLEGPLCAHHLSKGRRRAWAKCSGP
jgi:hypothetical protein